MNQRQKRVRVVLHQLQIDHNGISSIRSQRGDATFVSVLRDWKGALVDGRVARAKVANPLLGKLLAIRLACGMARALGISNVYIESNNQQAIKLSVSELVPPWEVLPLVLDIRQLRQYLGLSFSWVKRSGNLLAHTVATKALRNLLPFSWVAAPPFFLSSVVNSESFPVL
ncbi:hypothetical protein RHSIM_Rhsim03G0134300 [Rhododendron simsii]|uniref:RNase H type-1 domain-containing protein n=1 Tax=Rhododendron simsii TaxID=118357 RepID=A0A834H8U2_RHOSS|nr:hypothetical protein RHSIM_Rhsim03G0134300 [Rhododendron simsii]